MNQNTIDKKFPTQEALEIIDKINIKIDEILSDPISGSGSIYVLKSDIENIIKLLFNSVLEGEFIRNPNIKDDINNIKSSIYRSEDLENKLQNVQNEMVKSFLSEIRELIYLIEILLEEYFRFVNSFELLLNEEKDYIFSVSQNKKSITTKQEEYNLFLINLDLCISDIQLNESSIYVSNIEQIKSYISEGGYLSEQKEKMRKKANFLLFKWYKRAEVNKKNISSVVDGEEKGNYEKEVISYGEKWENTVEYINSHYFEGKERELKKSFKLIKDKELDKFSCQDIHLYIKYYKDIEENLNKLDNIIKVIDSKKNTDIVYTTIFQYAVNNRFSLFLEKCSDKNKIYEEYYKIKEDNNQNYFPQYKFIKTIVSIVNKQLQKENISVEEITDLESFINEKLEPEYQEYKANMEWSLQHSNFIYRVVYDECIFDGIFIYSSFVLPAPNKDAHDKFEILNSNYQTLKTRIDPLKKISSLLSEIKKRDVKTIELMGLFSAIIAFVMGSIPGFQFIKEIYSAILFLLVFSTGLISFLLVLLLITKHNENDFNKKWWMILLFYLFMGGAMCYINSKLENQAKNEKEFSQQNTDDNLTKTKKDLKILNHMEMEKDSVPKENGISIPKN